MTITLPADITLCAAEKRDLQAICELARACELVDLGHAETLPADIEDMWEDTNLDSDSFVLFTDTGQLVGYTAVCPDREYILLDPHTGIHPTQRQRGLESSLLALAEERARQLLVTAELPIPPLIRAWAFSTPLNMSRLQMYEREGYRVTTSEINLEITLESEPDAPQALQGITTRLYRPGQDERAIHTVIQESFQDIGGRPYRTFEEWSERATGHAHFDPRQLYVALAGSQIVGAITCRTYEGQGYEGQPEGHITQLGVLRPWRKHGIARHLIQQVFAAYYQRGIRHITISVDAHNPTGARQLYQAMGMREYEHVHNLLKQLL
jgi:mycothiol synthase